MGVMGGKSHYIGLCGSGLNHYIVDNINLTEYISIDIGIGDFHSQYIGYQNIGYSRIELLISSIVGLPGQ